MVLVGFSFYDVSEGLDWLQMKEGVCIRCTSAALMCLLIGNL